MRTHHKHTYTYTKREREGEIYKCVLGKRSFFHVRFMYRKSWFTQNLHFTPYSIENVSLYPKWNCTNSKEIFPFYFIYWSYSFPLIPLKRWIFVVSLSVKHVYPHFNVDKSNGWMLYYHSNGITMLFMYDSILLDKYSSVLATYLEGIVTWPIKCIFLITKQSFTLT